MSVISLSSSPARLFARSPTPIASSPNSPADAWNTRGESNRSRYKDAPVTRDSFSIFSPNKYPALELKIGAENLPVCSPSRLKFKSSAIHPSSNHGPVRSFNSGRVDGVARRDIVSQPQLKTCADTTSADKSQSNVIQITASDLRKSKKLKTALKGKPSSGFKVPTRKTDWTPTKDTAGTLGPDATKVSSFPVNLAENFGYASGFVTDTVGARDSADGPSTKRRKTDIMNSKPHGTSVQLKPTSVTVQSNAKTAKPRSKSPTKKALTITARATSIYLGEAEETPMMAFLTSTQARQEGAERGVDTIQTKVSRGASKKKTTVRSRLKSPSTVMKSMQGQDVIFASASQLARDESPRLLRDTVEAMKQSEASASHACLPSSQTAPISIASTTPEKLGTAKFRGRRNLWSAADRDEDNALLYFDDFPGSPCKSRTEAVSITWTRDLIRLSESYDVDDILAPFKSSTTRREQSSGFLNRQPVVQLRAFSTIPVQFAPPPPTTTTEALQHVDDVVASDDEATEKGLPKMATEEAAITKSNRPQPEMPDYSSMPDADLKVMLKAYGFKRLRKRENIIAKLEDCWRAQHNVPRPDPKEAARLKARLAAETRAQREEEERHAQQASHGAFLSAVHDIAARPMPKEAKAKGPRKKKAQKDADRSIKDTASPRKRKLGEKGVTEQFEVNISDVEDDFHIVPHDAFARINALQVPGDTYDVSDIADIDSVESSPVKGTGVQAARDRDVIGMQTPGRLTIATSQTLIESSPGFEPNQSIEAEISETAPSGDSHDLEGCILPALLAQKPSSKPAQNPTWHQKMLMYDPIILEDFTAWLNTSGLNNIGEDGEIDINAVKTWLESHGICCLWNGGWRGNKTRINEAEE